VTQIKMNARSIPFVITSSSLARQSVLPLSHDYSTLLLTAVTDPIIKTTCAILRVLVVPTRPSTGPDFFFTMKERPSDREHNTCITELKTFRP
jgi:hypothetical protein